MTNQNDFAGFDVIPPKGPVTVSIEMDPDEIELAFASEGASIQSKILKALVIAMVNDPISA